MSGTLPPVRRPGSAPSRCFTDWTDRIASGELPPATSASRGRRAQSGDHDVGLGKALGAPRHGRNQHRQNANPTVNAKRAGFYGAELQR